MMILLRYGALLFITVIFQLIFTFFFRFAVNQIIEGYSEESASQMHVLLKYAAFFFVFVFIALILLWNVIDFAAISLIQKIIVSLFFFYFLSYCKSCVGMIDHLVCLIYRPEIAGDVEYDCLWGEFKVVDNKPMLIQDFARLNLDISKRL